jgi:hypothetical protein
MTGMIARSTTALKRSKAATTRAGSLRAVGEFHLGDEPFAHAFGNDLIEADAVRVRCA